MKKILILLTLLTSPTFAQYVGQGGVNFLKGNLRTPFDVAKTQNKMVFIEVYSPTCHVCQSFVPVFENPAVGGTYNQQFVSYKLDINSQEAQAFFNTQKIWIPSLPMLLYFDKDVKLHHIGVMGEGMNQASIVLKAASDAMNPKVRASGAPARYKSGVRDPGFLIDLGLYSRIQKDTAQSILAMNDYAKTLSKEAMSSEMNFIALQKIVLDTENPMFKYLISNMNVFYAKYPKQQVNSVAENIIMSSLYSSRGNSFTSLKVNELKGYLLKVGIDAKSAENRTLMVEVNALFRQNQAQQAIDRILKYIKIAGPGPKEYEFLCKYVRGRSKDPKILAQITDWCKKGGIK